MIEIALPLDKLEDRNGVKHESFSYATNPAIKKLLDVLSLAIANEYIEVAKENKDMFMDPCFSTRVGPASGWRGDDNPEHLGVLDPRPSTSLRACFRGDDKEKDGNGRQFKPYYVAHTKIRTLALLDDKYKGSNWYNWRRERDLNPR